MVVMLIYIGGSSMKRIIDSYSTLNGKKQYISEETIIVCNDKVATETIRSISDRDSCSESIISRIIFSPICDEAIMAVKDAFGNVYKKTDDEYIIIVKHNEIIIYTDTDNGVRYAACAVLGHYDDGICEGILYNAPICPYRGVKLYIPDENSIDFFKQFVDMCMYYGYNKLVLEIGGAMEYKRHPEINEGWVEYCKKMRDHFDKGHRINDLLPWAANSVHLENGGGSYLLQPVLKELCEYCNKRGIEIIPEVPSLSHSDYLLTRHPELAENKADPYPRSYCPSCEETYKLLFDVMDEIIEVFNPKMIHIAHDEWIERISENCERCAGKDAADVYAQDIIRIYNYLKSKGIKTMMWGDMLMDYTFYADGTGRAGGKMRRRFVPNGEMVPVNGKEYPVYKTLWSYDVDMTSEGIYKEIPPTYKAIEKIPKDIMIMDWLTLNASGKYNTIVLKKHGLDSVLGNLHPTGVIEWCDYVQNGVKGVSISNWSFVTEKYMQRNGQFFGIVFAAMMVWNRDFNAGKKHENIRQVSNEIFNYKYRDIMKLPHIEIIHTSNVANVGSECVCGQEYNDDADRLGCYRIFYEDGEEETTDILLGTNIGYSDLDFDELSEDGEWRSYYPSNRIFSTTYTCDFVVDDNSDKKYYKILLPLKKKAVAVEPEILEKYQTDVLVKKITINNYFSETK